ncbi:MFS transporter [Actinoplanes teichomyceticus]|uniref:Putative MFS family arabinose efflux permease n=1 Tax=Actinoplanes teichomyceticus TaxID=1867 RepID=A0A561VMF9_ACTTI|nr:MFS transporter [Actinoplanes teichomyceticus]TWG12780.1 putative MFS family arabinose efflux permease [Actinoplanes teichomyceticus]GIF13515.1 MFS transporter [Actinoplanes teichomyceticus]
MTALVAGDRRGTVLRHRDFRLFWVGQTTSTFGSAITAVALPLVAVGALNASTLHVAALQAAVWLPWLLIGLPAGVWVDRLRRRPVMITCNTVSLLLVASVPAAAWLNALTIAHLLTVALLAGAAAVFSETAHQVYLPSLLSGDRLAEGNAKLHGSEAAAQVAGPGAGGLIAQLLGAVFGLLADASTFLVCTVCLLTLRHREPRPSPRTPHRPLLGELTEGLRFLRHDPYLRTMAVFGAAANLALTGYQSILVVFLVRENAVTEPGTVGVILALMSGGGVLGALVATTVARRCGTARGLLLCHLATAPFALLIPLAGPGPGLTLVVLAGTAVGTGIVAGNIIKDSFRQTYTPRHLLGRVVTGMQLVNYGTMPLGALLGGLLGTALGVRPAVWIMTGALVLSTGILLTGPIRHHRDLPDSPGRPAHVPAEPPRARDDPAPADG